jgi:hypothetical protein
VVRGFRASREARSDRRISQEIRSRRHLMPIRDLAAAPSGGDPEFTWAIWVTASTNTQSCARVTLCNSGSRIGACAPDLLMAAPNLGRVSSCAARVSSDHTPHRPGWSSAYAGSSRTARSRSRYRAGCRRCLEPGGARLAFPLFEVVAGSVRLSWRHSPGADHPAASDGLDVLGGRARKDLHVDDRAVFVRAALDLDADRSGHVWRWRCCSPRCRAGYERHSADGTPASRVVTLQSPGTSALRRAQTLGRLDPGRPAPTRPSTRVARPGTLRQRSVRRSSSATELACAGADMPRLRPPCPKDGPLSADQVMEWCTAGRIGQNRKTRHLRPELCDR